MFNSSMASNEVRNVATLYGLGRMNTVIGDITLSVSSESSLSLVDNSLYPNPFEVSALVTNRSGRPVYDIQVKIELPFGLRLTDSEELTKNVGTLVNGGSGKVAWRVTAEEYGADEVYTYKVLAGRLTESTSNTIVNKSVFVPGILTGLFVKDAELFIDDNDPGEGNGIKMEPIDGRFDSDNEGITRTVNIGYLSEGIHIAHVRGQDSEGDWGAVSSYEFTVDAPSIDPNISVYPEADTEIYARRAVHVPVILDLTESTYKAGEFQAFITWPSDLLSFVSVSGGTTPGTGISSFPIIPNTDNVDNGELTVTYINTKGLEGKTTLFILRFWAIGKGGEQGEVGLNLTSLSSITTFTNLLPMTEITDYQFTIVDTALWGDVDNNESVQNRDAFILMAYSVGRDVSKYSDHILQRGDVNADNEINSLDALICKIFSISPDDESLIHPLTNTPAPLPKRSRMPPVPLSLPERHIPHPAVKYP